MLILIGLHLMVYSQYKFAPMGKKIDSESAKKNRQKPHPIPWTPIIGAVIFLGGLLIISIPNKKDDK